MYQATINPNALSSLPTSPPPFTPPNYAIWVNALWFLSLVISITCALLATLLQQWARRYLKATQTRYSLHKRARIRAFFAEGVDKFLLPWAVEALPTMLHLSLFLFFAGLAVFLWNVNLTVFKLVLSWIGLCVALYGCITFIPIFYHDSPYLTPLSFLVWHFVPGIRFLTFRALEWITHLTHSWPTHYRFRDLAEDYGKLLARGMHKAAEESAFNSPPLIDTRAFMWTFECLDEDHELERFFAGLPGFRGSKMVKDPLPDLTSEQQRKLLNALIGLSDRTSSSDLLPEQVKMRRTVICRKAIGPTNIPRLIHHALERVTFEDQYGRVQSAEIASLVRGWDNGENELPTLITRGIVSTVIARAQRHDDLWFTLASKEMSVSESVLRNYATHGNNLSLAIFNYLVRHQLILLEQMRGTYLSNFSQVLEAATKFDVLDTSPELQHEFCELWNQLVHDGSFRTRWILLRPIRNIYLTLHQHTDSAPIALSTSTNDEDVILGHSSTYPLCTIPGHRPHPATDIHNVSASTATPRPVLHDNTAPGPTFPPDATSSSVITPILIDKNTVAVPQVVLVPSSRAHQTVMGDFHDPATSSDPAAAITARDNTSAQTIPPTIHAASSPTPPVPPPAEVSFQNNADLLASHSGSPEIPPSTSPEPVLENILPTGTSPTLTITCPNLTHVLPRIPFLGDSQYVSGHLSMANLRTWVGCRY